MNASPTFRRIARHLTPVVVLGLMLAAAPVSAQQSQGDHSMKNHGGDAAASPVDQAFEQANQRMHRDMAVPLTGDADRNFALSMIPHHQGAIDMARIVLEHGKDPALRKVAQDVVSAQEREIAELKEWLAKHPN